MARTHFRIEGNKRFREAAAALRKAGRDDLRKEMVTEMKGAASPILRDQRLEVLGLHVVGHAEGTRQLRGRYVTAEELALNAVARGDRTPIERLVNLYGGPTKARKVRRKASRGLRRRVADSLDVEVRTTAKNPLVRFKAKGEKMPEGQSRLPKHLDSGRGWRHPLFGNRERWVGQTGGSYFWPPIKKGIRFFRSGIDAAITRTVEKIEKS